MWFTHILSSFHLFSYNVGLRYHLAKEISVRKQGRVQTHATLSLIPMGVFDEHTSSSGKISNLSYYRDVGTKQNMKLLAAETRHP